MIKKYLVLICVTISLTLMLIAIWVYPGGSMFDANSVGFEWSRNFITNLFAEKAMNGADNDSRIWAIVGMAFHSVGYGIFFVNMSRKMSSKHAAKVLVIVGAANIVASFLITTSLHDIMVTVSSTLSMLGLFYITVFILKTRLHWLKLTCVGCMLMFYFTLYLYGAGDWQLLAIMQKVSLISSMLLILSLEYFTQASDFMAAASSKAVPE